MSENPTMPLAAFTLGSLTATPGALVACVEFKYAKVFEVLGDEARDNFRRIVTADGNLAREASCVSSRMIERHAAKDWGDLDAEDKAANDRALLDGSRILSCYLLGDFKFYVITEAKDDDGIRSHTTILLAHEY